MTTTIAITNPSDSSAESGIVEEYGAGVIITPERILSEFGSRLEDGAQVTMIEGDRVWQYLATRDRRTESIALRSNNGLADGREDGETFIDFVAAVNGHWEYIIESAYIALETTPEPVELNTYTVFGSDDDGERFVNVCTAETPEQAAEQTKTAVLVDEGYEHLVRVDIVLTGDHSDAEAVNV